MNLQLKSQNNSGSRRFITNPLVLLLAGVLLISIFFVAKANIKEKNQEEESQAELQKARQEEYVNVNFASSEEASLAINDPSYQLVDIRETFEFEQKHIQSSLNLPLSEAEKNIGAIDRAKKIIIIDKFDTARGRIFTDHLAQQGLDAKYLEGGIMRYAQDGFLLINKGNPAWGQDLIKVTSLDAKQIKEKIESGSLIALVDTQTEIGFNRDHLPGAINIPLEDIEDKLQSLPLRTIVVYDNDPLGSFRAAVKLYDMNIFDVFNSLDNTLTLKGVLYPERPAEKK